MPRTYTLGEFRPVRRASRLGRIIQALRPGDNVAEVGLRIDVPHEDVDAALRAARRTHGIDHRVDEEGTVSLVLPDGVSDPLEPIREQQPTAPENGVASTTKTRIADTSRIRLLVDKNPKRPTASAHARFELYRDGQTVAEFLAAGGTKGDLSWDRTHRFIDIVEAA